MLTKMAKMPTYTWDWLRQWEHDHIMSSMLDVEELLYQEAHADVGQTAHAVVCQTKSLSGWTDSLPLCLVLSQPSIYGRRWCLTTTNYLNNCFSRNGLVNYASAGCGSLAFAASLNCCEGTQMANLWMRPGRGGWGGAVTPDEKCHGVWIGNRWKWHGARGTSGWER